MSELIELMKNKALEVNLPKFYKCDLDIDYDRIPKYHGNQCIWLLRECGSMLVPLYSGVEPIHITYHLKEIEVRLFLIDTVKMTISEISREKAAELVQRSPYHFNFSSLNRYEKIDAIYKVIEKGVKNNYWNTIGKTVNFNGDTPLIDMYNFFSFNKNEQMMRLFKQVI